MAGYALVPQQGSGKSAGDLCRACFGSILCTGLLSIPFWQRQEQCFGGFQPVLNWTGDFDAISDISIESAVQECESIGGSFALHCMVWVLPSEAHRNATTVFQVNRVTLGRDGCPDAQVTNVSAYAGAGLWLEAQEKGLLALPPSEQCGEGLHEVEGATIGSAMHFAEEFGSHHPLYTVGDWDCQMFAAAMLENLTGCTFIQQQQLVLGSVGAFLCSLGNMMMFNRYTWPGSVLLWIFPVFFCICGCVGYATEYDCSKDIVIGLGLLGCVAMVLLYGVAFGLAVMGSCSEVPLSEIIQNA